MRLLNKRPPSSVRWYLFDNKTNRYLSTTGYSKDTKNAYYYTGDSQSTSKEIKETFDGITDKKIINKLECVGEYIENFEE